MKLTKLDEDILFLKNKIDERFHKNYLKKLEEIKNKIHKYKAEQIYKKASRELYDRISKISQKVDKYDGRKKKSGYSGL